jgi:hypothetical protein
MKTPEQILKEKLSVDTIPDYTFHKVIEAMEEYATQLMESNNNTPCPCCSSTNTYGTYAIHCTNCAVTTEI